MFRFKLQLRFLIKGSKKLIIDADVLSPCQNLPFLINLQGSREERKQIRREGKGDRLVGGSKGTPSRVPMTLVLRTLLNSLREQH